MPGEILGMELFEFTGDNVPEVLVTANYAPENKTFGLVLSHWPDQCDAWRKTGISIAGVSFLVTSIVNPVLDGSKLTGSENGVLHSYAYDPAQDLIIRSPR